MKLDPQKLDPLLVLFALSLLLSPLTALGEESCSRVEPVCVDTMRDYHARFYIAKNEAFEASLKQTAMSNLICRHFSEEGDGSVKADFSWNRVCRFGWPQTVVEERGIGGCSDFTIFGADEHFIGNCNELLGHQLSYMLPQNSSYNLKQLIVEAKGFIQGSFANRSEKYLVEQALKSILDENYIFHNLHQLKAEFIKAKDLCALHSQAWICSYYKDSEKQILSLGGYNFLEPQTIKAMVYYKVAEHVGSFIHRELYSERMGAYFKFLTDFLNRNEFERIIARNLADDAINLSTNALLVLRQTIYHSEANFGNQLGYFCYEDPRTEQGEDFFQEKSGFYDGNFQRLHPLDQVELISCPVGNGAVTPVSFEEQARFPFITEA